MASAMSSPDVLYGLRAAESAVALLSLAAAPLLKAPAPSTNGHSEITTVVRAVKVPRRQLIVFLLSAVALTALADGLVVLANAIFNNVVETTLPAWRGIEFYSVALVIAFGGFAVVGSSKEARGVPIWQSALLKGFVLVTLALDLALVVLIPFGSSWSEDPNPHVPESSKVGVAPVLHLALGALRVLVLFALSFVLFCSRTSYEPVGQNGAAPQTSETSQLISPPDAGSAEASAGLASPKAKYGTFEPAPPAEEAPSVSGRDKHDHGEVPGYSVDTPRDSRHEAHILPVPALDAHESANFVPSESGPVALGPGPQIVPVEQLVAATVQSEEPHEEPESSKRSVHEVQPEVSYAAVASGSKTEDAPKTEEPATITESPAPVAFPQSDSTPAVSPAPLAFPKGDDDEPTRPALRETTSSGSGTPGISFAPGTEGERIRQAAHRIRKISQGAAAKSGQGLARLARRMSVGPNRHSSDGPVVPSENPVPIKPEEQQPTDQSAEVKPDVSFAAVAGSKPDEDVSFPRSETPLAFPKGDDDASVAGSNRPQLRETTSAASGASTPNVSFAPGTEGERIRQAAHRIRKISQGAAAKSGQGLARLARRMSQGPSRQGSISSVTSPPGSPGFVQRESSSLRQSLDDSSDKKKDKKKKDKGPE